MEIKSFPETRVVAVHHTGPYEQIGEAFRRLGDIAGRSGLPRRTEPSMIALYHDDPRTTPRESLRSEAALIVDADSTTPPGLEEERIPAGEYACTLHVGPYEHLPHTWERFKTEWLPASGRRAASGPAVEAYLNDPGDTPKQELRTELRIPLAPA